MSMSKSEAKDLAKKMVEHGRKYGFNQKDQKKK